MKIVMVNPITKEPTSYEPPPYVTLIFTGQYQNVAIVPSSMVHSARAAEHFKRASEIFKGRKA
jgi:hypothetical protein